ncbi:prephenate dehydrogenase [Suicoccus acidiformans]|nr:prephenate dehydrogenase [Suicoccus acidiformans]
MRPLNIALVGLGVIGGSFAKGLRAQNVIHVNLLGIDTNAATIQRALDERIITQGETSNESILQQADVVIISLYPDDLVDFIQTHQDAFKKGAIITDTVGVKGSLIQQVEAILRPDVDYIFGHPMAGRENQGYEYAEAGVFHGANYLLMPRPRNQQANIDKLELILDAIGFRRITHVTPEFHDEMIAYTSQLCHVLAVALMNSDRHDRDTASFVGDSFRELTRIAKINDELWAQLFLYNKESLLESMAAFETEWQAMKQAIQTSNSQDLKEMFRESTKRRSSLEQTDLKLNIARNVAP